MIEVNSAMACASFIQAGGASAFSGGMPTSPGAVSVDRLSKVSARLDRVQEHDGSDGARFSKPRDGRLASTLDIPLRQHNALLLAAGFAPEWRQRDLAAPDMAQVTNALDYILAQDILMTSHCSAGNSFRARSMSLLRPTQGCASIAPFRRSMVSKSA